MKLHILKTLALAAALACSAAHADTLKVSNYTGGGAADAFSGAFLNLGSFDTVTTQPWQVSNLTTNGSFVAFCLERLVPVSAAAFGAGETYTASAYTSAAVVNLFNGFYGSALTSANSAAAFQLALWELLEDSANTKDLFAGNFNLTGYDFNLSTADFGTATTLATSMLAGTGAASDSYQLTMWDARGSQDLISAVAAPIPEPSTYALMAGGLGIMGYLARRRRQA
ncbi:PEP-CTERM sorting domain-containing protein [Aquabacterium sp. J223]|uniref:PEP-CTERM sorting domain-containing protein n=1 Tax=Aquabacterium sp. J223 TaxID=2898431 RepID=UPI0021AE0C07|nr:PEP-CTERM sorting domain-containing protein [Aquabacterium sp. J223]UUX95087.1 PEP-CTERM sorting domain-containing protein [Aquabacterium sp. J223]